jgi:hypothetical protein
MCTIAQLQRVAGKVNTRIHRGTVLTKDHLLLVELMKEGVNESELGEAYPLSDSDEWFWTPFPNVRFIQYRSGRVAVVGG